MPERQTLDSKFPRDSRPLVCILGSGRSGTSVLMHVLSGVGMSLSDELVPASEQNPKGAFEDRVIMEAHRGLLESFGPLTVPPPCGWIDRPKVQRIQRALRDHVKRQLDEHPGTWGFKEPLTALLLPMWQPVFERLHVSPRYVLAVRDPAAVVMSMCRQYAIPQSVGELIWLTRNAAALAHTGGDAFICHYEEWFSANGPDLLAAVARFCGLAANDELCTEIYASRVNAQLNRAASDAYAAPANGAVRKLYDSLRAHSGEVTDKNALLGALAEAQTAANEYAGWVHEVHRVYHNFKRADRKRVELEQQLGAAAASVESGNGAPRGERESSPAPAETSAEIEQLKGELAQVTRSWVESTAQIASLQEALEEANITQVNQQAAIRDTPTPEHRGGNETRRLQQDLATLRASTAFKIGQAFATAAARPGRATLALPARLLRLFIERALVRRHLATANKGRP